MEVRERQQWSLLLKTTELVSTTAKRLLPIVRNTSLDTSAVERPLKKHRSNFKEDEPTTGTKVSVFPRTVNGPALTIKGVQVNGSSASSSTARKRKRKEGKEEEGLSLNGYDVMPSGRSKATGNGPRTRKKHVHGGDLRTKPSIDHDTLVAQIQELMASMQASDHDPTRRTSNATSNTIVTADGIDQSVTETTTNECMVDETVLPVTQLQVDQLSMAQQRAYDRAVNSHRNLFFTGGAGVGKTHLLRLITQQWRYDDPGTCVVLAQTGMAAQHIPGAQTINSFLELPPNLTVPQKSSVRECVEFLHKKENFAEKMKMIKRLAIDEISMVTIPLFELLNAILIRFRGDSRPFGGVQVICSGDFYQLPPFEEDRTDVSVVVKQQRATADAKQRKIAGKRYEKRRAKSEKVAPRDYGTKALYCFESPVWYTLFGDDDYCLLTVCYRQKDDGEFIDMLNEVRGGEASEKTLARLATRRVSDEDVDEDDEFNEKETEEETVDMDIQVPSNYVPSKEHRRLVPSLFCKNWKVDNCNAENLERMLARLAARQMRSTSTGVSSSTNDSNATDDAARLRWVSRDAEVERPDWSFKYMQLYTLRKQEYAYHLRCWNEDRDRANAEIHMRRFLNKYQHMRKTYNDIQTDVTKAVNRTLPPAQLKLIPDMPVMLMKNINVKAGLVNGRRGFILSIDAATGYPWVGWIGLSKPTLVAPLTWSFPYNLGKLSITQFPLKPAFAFTVHKLQGTSLQRGVADLSDAFTPGQVYSALSRFEKLSGLKLLGFAPDKIVADYRVRRFYEHVDSLCASAQTDMAGAEAKIGNAGSSSSTPLTVAPVHKLTVKEKIAQLKAQRVTGASTTSVTPNKLANTVPTTTATTATTTVADPHVSPIANTSSAFRTPPPQPDARPVRLTHPLTMELSVTRAASRAHAPSHRPSPLQYRRPTPLTTLPVSKLVGQLLPRRPRKPPQPNFPLPTARTIQTTPYVTPPPPPPPTADRRPPPHSTTLWSDEFVV